MSTYHELFIEGYFAIAESTRTNCMKELSPLYALSKLKYSKHCWYFQYLLLQQVILIYIWAPFNTHVQCAPGQLEKEWSVVINVVCGFTKNVTHPQKTLAMICLIFADLTKTIRMTLLTILGSSSPLQMSALQMIKLYPRKHIVILIQTH